MALIVAVLSATVAGSTVSFAANGNPTLSLQNSCYIFGNFSQGGSKTVTLYGKTFAVLFMNVTAPNAAEVSISNTQLGMHVNQSFTLGNSNNYSFYAELLGVSPQATADMELCATNSTVSAPAYISNASQTNSTNATASIPTAAQPPAATQPAASNPAESSTSGNLPVTAIIPALIGIIAAIVIGYLVYNSGKEDPYA